MGRLKCPCMVLVIEWQPRWTNCVYVRYTGDLSIGTCVWATYAMKVEMAQRCCKTHTCDDEGAHCTWDMTLSHVIKVEKIKTWLGLMDRLQAWRASWRLWSDGPRGGEAWAKLGADGRRQRWKASEVKINEPIWSRDDMNWIISLLIMLVHVLHQHWRRWNGMRKAKV